MFMGFCLRIAPFQLTSLLMRRCIVFRSLPCKKQSKLQVFSAVSDLSSKHCQATAKCRWQRTRDVFHAGTPSLVAVEEQPRLGFA